MEVFFVNDIVSSGSTGTLAVCPRRRSREAWGCEDVGEDGRDEARLEARDDAFDAVRLDDWDGALVDAVESTGPHHSGRRLPTNLTLLGFEEKNSGRGGSSLQLCDLAKEGNFGAIIELLRPTITDRWDLQILLT